MSGGTALSAFYLYHRLSEDLDFFTIDQNVSFDSVNAEMIKLFHSLKMKIDHQVSSSTFLQYILKNKKQTLKVDLVKDVPLHFGKLKITDNIRIDSLENISVGKLLALFGRADAKDFIDLYFLLEKEKMIDFESIFTMAKQKDIGLHELYLAEMISHIEKIKHFPKTLKPYKHEDMNRFFLDLSNQLLKRIKPHTKN